MTVVVLAGSHASGSAAALPPPGAASVATNAVNSASMGALYQSGGSPGRVGIALGALPAALNL